MLSEGDADPAEVIAQARESRSPNRLFADFGAP